MYNVIFFVNVGVVAFTSSCNHFSLLVGRMMTNGGGGGGGDEDDDDDDEEDDDKD